MNASLAQSVIVWAALSIGLASVLYCLLSAAVTQPSPGGDEAGEQTMDGEADCDVEEAASC